jgi:ribonuclease E
MKKEMLINVAQPEECRIAVLEDGRLEELYIERSSHEAIVGNIYRGRIVNLEPSIQAAFVDFGIGRNGFMHISDVEPQYFRQGGYDPEEIMRESDEMAEAAADRAEKNGRRRRVFKGGRPRVKPPIQEIFKRGDEVLVQCIKEGIGSKGPTLSTYISIPGRYLVLMPPLGRVGVSRKLEDIDLRRSLRQTLLDLQPPKGLGFIVRTAGQERTKNELGRDMNYLLRLWKAISRKVSGTQQPGVIYEESDMIIRTIRDIFTSDIDAIWIDEPTAHERAKEFLEMVMPKFADRLRLYEGRGPLFHHYKLEEEIVRIHQRTVPLQGGGSIVIDPTEALVAIDVNSGTFRSDGGNAEETAYQLNLSAAKEIARQLRLRDLGGVIVNDFIDMRKETHRRRVERALRDAMRRDRARTKILRTSPFGLIEMTRQRIRPSLKRSVYTDCPCCQGRGMVKTPESMSIEVMRLMQLACRNEYIRRVTIRVHEEVASFLNNRKRRELMQLEEAGNMVVQILGSETHFPEHLDIDCRDDHGEIVELDS